MGLLPLTLILLVVQISGCPWCRLVVFFLAPFLITVLFLFVFLFCFCSATLHGPGLWKLNVSVLNDDEYKRLISEFWSSWQCRQNNFSYLSEWWEVGKLTIIELSINYCCSRSKQQRCQRALLVRLAEHLKLQVDLARLSSLGHYRSTLSELAKFDLDAAQGAQVTSRIKWAKEGESIGSEEKSPE